MLGGAKKRNATDVIFVGDPYGSFRFIDKLAALPSLIRGRPFLWAPHAYVHGLKIKLHEHKITLRDPLEFLPELAANAGLQVGAHCENYDAHRDLRGVTEYLEKKIESQRWREVCQTVIVDQGRVVMPRVELRTNRLIKKFGSSPERKSAVFPVLCKIVVPPFEKVDVPTIGLDTVRLCAENGIRAIVVQGGKTILMQPDDVRAFADRGSISVYAL